MVIARNSTPFISIVLTLFHRSNASIASMTWRFSLRHRYLSTAIYSSITILKPMKNASMFSKIIFPPVHAPPTWHPFVLVCPVVRPIPTGISSNSDCPGTVSPYDIGT